MNYYNKRDLLKKAAKEILEDGDSFLIKKKNGEIIFETDDPKKMEKSYKVRSLLKRYHSRHLVIWGAFSVFIMLFYLLVALLIHLNSFYQSGINISYLDNWIIYLGLFILYFITLNKTKNILQKISFLFFWKNLRVRLLDISVDEHFLVNEYGDNKEFSDLVLLISDALYSEKRNREI